MQYKGRSNLEDAQELWDAAGRPVNMTFFPISELDAVVEWCRDRKVVYRHETS